MEKIKRDKFRVGVVPEHFSIPWFFGQEKGIFEKFNIDIELEEYPRGTGSMVRALQDNGLDIAVALTEGIVADITENGTDIKIISTYVQSPLHWAVVVSPQSSATSIEDLKEKTFGISRFGSGSHLMTYLMGHQRTWNMETDIKFSVKGGLVDLLGGIKDHSTDTFLWETFTVKHYCDDNQIKKIGEVVTPWPCFVIVARTDVIRSQTEAVKRFLSAIKEATISFKQHREEALQLVSRKSKLSLEDSAKWFDGVEFSDGSVSKQVLRNVVGVLRQTGVLKHDFVDIDKLYDSDVATICE